MATLKKYRTHAQFSAGLEVVEVEYDFAKDAGAQGDLDIIQFKDAVVIVDAWLKCDAAGAGTNAVLTWGVKAGDVDACLDATSGAVTNLTLGAVIPGETACKNLKVAADGVMKMTIATADLTAGKFRFCMLLQKY